MKKLKNLLFIICLVVLGVPVLMTLTHVIVLIPTILWVDGFKVPGSIAWKQAIKGHKVIFDIRWASVISSLFNKGASSMTE